MRQVNPASDQSRLKPVGPILGVIVAVASAIAVLPSTEEDVTGQRMRRTRTVLACIRCALADRKVLLSADETIWSPIEKALRSEDAIDGCMHCDPKSLELARKREDGWGQQLEVEIVAQYKSSIKIAVVSIGSDGSRDSHVKDDLTVEIIARSGEPEHLVPLSTE